MKLYKSAIVFLSCSFFLSACQDYLDVKPSTQQSYIESAEDCQLLLDNYSVMNTGYPSDLQASSDDYYLLTTRLDQMTQEDKEVFSWVPSAQRQLADPQWQTPYWIVYQANLILEAIGDLQGTTDVAALNNLRGSALFYRSYIFWMLAQQYTKPYSAATAGTDPGIPLRVTSDMNDKYGRGTVQQVYDRITEDLKEAAGLLPDTAVVSSRPSKVAALAMLARVYLTTGDFQNALTNANASLQIKSYLKDLNTASTTSSTPFSPRFTNWEILFQAVMATSPLLAPGSSSNPLTRINPEIVNLYEAGDLRKQVFLKAASDGTYRFTGNYEPVTGGNMFCGLAVDEVLLIRAECYARSGNTTGAMNDLNTLLRARYTNTVPYSDKTATSSQDALNQVLQERRKELLMRGLRWTDLRRLNLPATRQTYTYSLSAGDLRYTLLIPREVITLAGMEQNPR